MSRAKRLIAAVVCAALFAGPAIGQSVEEKADPARFGASLLAALIANNRAIESYDVIIELEFLDTRPSRERTLTLTTRRLKSNPGGHHLFARQTLTDAIGAEVSDSGTGIQPNSSVVAAFFGKRPHVFLLTEKGRRRISNSGLGITKYRLHWSTLETIGINCFPHVEVSTEGSAREWDKMTVPGEYLSSRMLSESEAEVVYTAPESFGEYGKLIWRFSLETLMPSQKRGVMTNIQTGKSYLKERESYEWELRDGIYLPTTVRSEEVQIFVDKSGEHVPYEHIREARFSWLRVNEEIEESEFDPERFTGVADVVEFLRPDEATSK